jgi:predicted transcriptional regulator
MNVILSIKPQFVKQIFNGQKKYEFRRVIFKKTNIKKVIIYASFPVKKIVGEFEIETILSDSPSDFWYKTQEFAGTNQDHFFDYFSGKKIGFAIKIKKLKKYRIPIDLFDLYGIKPPQSFCYI